MDNWLQLEQVWTTAIYRAEPITKLSTMMHACSEWGFTMSQYGSLGD